MRVRRLEILRLRLRSLFFRRRVERELEKELRFHLEAEIEEHRAGGLSPEQARIAAMRELGGVAQIQEECRDMRRTAVLETLGQDVRYAFRTLRRTPAFTWVIVLTLALSIGATSAIVSVLEGVLIKPLPFRDPGRLVRAYTKTALHPKFPINPNDFRDARSRLRVFESFAAYTHRDLQLAGAGEPVRLSGFAVTAGYFHVLGFRPAIGREFNRDDELPGRGNVVILSDRVWRTKLRAAPGVLGKTIRLDQTPYTIIGVMPPGVQHPGNAYHSVLYGNTVEIWTPFTFSSPNDRGSHYLDAIARLRPGISLAQAQGEFLSTMRQIAREHFGVGGDVEVVLSPLETEIVGRTKPLLFALIAAVALVLLLACVNAANLLLARATARQREMAVRAAVGAGRPRLIRQLLTESVVLALAAGTLGAVLAAAGTKILVALLPADFPRAADIHVDALMFLFTFAVAAITGLLFGLVPALSGSSTGLRESLYESGRSSTSARSTLRLRGGLVVSEVTLACLLLIAAGLILRSFVNLLHTDPGFQPDKVLTASLSLPHTTYKDNAAITHFGERLLAELRDTPGVSATGLGSDLPWTGWDDNAGGFTIRGETPPPDDSFQARYHMASSGYFRALGISIRRGREFDEHDTASGRKVLIINQAMAKFWQHGDPLGGQVTFRDHPKDSDWMTVVGIVSDVKDTPSSLGAKPAFWWPQPQEPFPFPDFSIVIRSNLDPGVAANRLRAALRMLDSSLPVADIRTMDRVADNSYSTSRFTLALIGLFATLALLLAAMGTYGVIAYSVSQRTLEFGVRLALGAKSQDLVASVLKQGMKLAVLGTVLGVLLGLAFSRFLGSLLYGVGSADPVAFLAAGLVGIGAAAIACLLPALRVTRVNPMTALRAD
ncbi:MAG TPA: ABC transporter permease [Bryobacteraceae bacterium]